MVETAAVMWGDRHMPASAVAEACKALEASGAIDSVLFADQLTNLIPTQLWTPENTPLAALMGDPDSHSDAFILGAWVHAAAPGLKLHISTDSVRRSPSEQVQAMLTLAHITEGRATFQVGGGEVKQTKAFGHPANQGMSRMKDLFEIYTRFMSSDAPISYEGRRWTYDRAFLGAAKQHRPELWALGSGPQLIDYATTYADGLGVVVPMAWTSPDAAATEISAIRRQLVDKGRDPDAFRIGMWFSTLMHENRGYIEQALENPILKFMTGIFGRIETDLWRAEGLPLPLPDGWTYYKDLQPHAMDDELIRDVVAAVTREHHELGWFIGTPGEAAAKAQPYIDAGADWVMPIDYMPLVAGPEDGANGLRRTIEFCAAVRAANSAAAAVAAR